MPSSSGESGEDAGETTYLTGEQADRADGPGSEELATAVDELVQIAVNRWRTS